MTRDELIEVAVDGICTVDWVGDQIWSDAEAALDAVLPVIADVIDALRDESSPRYSDFNIAVANASNLVRSFLPASGGAVD